MNPYLCLVISGTGVILSLAAEAIVAILTVEMIVETSSYPVNLYANIIDYTP